MTGREQKSRPERAPQQARATTLPIDLTIGLLSGIVLNKIGFV
jgi:hypothetical protein